PRLEHAVEGLHRVILAEEVVDQDAALREEAHGFAEIAVVDGGERNFFAPTARHTDRDRLVAPAFQYDPPAGPRHLENIRERLGSGERLDHEIEAVREVA